METLSVGMYVRTKKGIAKIIDRILEPDHYYFKMWVTDKFLEINDDTEYISEVDVIKASYNIIDILEVGDYVNGNKVDFTNNNNKLSYEDKCIGFYDGDGDITLFENGIKSVITHEQMTQMAYKVGE